MSENIIITESEIDDVLNEGFPLIYSLDEYWLNEGAIENTFNRFKEKFYKLTKYNLTMDDLYKPEKIKSVVEKINITKENKSYVNKILFYLLAELIIIPVALLIFIKKDKNDYANAMNKDEIETLFTGKETHKNEYKNTAKICLRYFSIFSIPTIGAALTSTDCARLITLANKQINKLYSLRNKTDDKEEKKDIDEKIKSLRDTIKVIKDEEKKRVKPNNRILDNITN